MNKEELELIARVAFRASSTAALCAAALARNQMLSASEMKTIAENLQGIADALDPTGNDEEAVQYHLLARRFRDQG